MESLKPMMMPGAPGSDTPMELIPGACSWMAYHKEGSVKLRWGSPHRMGEPVAVLLPLTAQLLLPLLGPNEGNLVIRISSSGNARGTVSRVMGLNFHSPVLSTTGLPTPSWSG